MTSYALLYTDMTDEDNNFADLHNGQFSYMVVWIVEQTCTPRVCNNKLCVYGAQLIFKRWRQDIESSSKLRTYSLVKKSLCVEPYILNMKGNHLITAMARYRMSSHDLKIERGRYNNPITPINQRICTRCESNEIDDEIHLLLHCNAMNNEREILLDSIAGVFNMQPTNDIFLRIMTSRDITVVKSLAKFIYGCFKQIKG